jgi:hypothetical protein
VILIMFLLKPRVVKVIIRRKKAIEDRAIETVKEVAEAKKPAAPKKKTASKRKRK